MPAVIEVQNLRKSYGETVAVDDVSFTVEEGEIFGILGPNGAGKTTTVECVEGLRAPDGGGIRVLGLDPRRDRAELTQQLGAQLQDSELPERLRVAEALRLYSSFYRQPADWRALMELLGLTGKAGTRFGKLSGGQKQRLSIALALVGGPRVAVLDELTTGLDPQARRDTWALIEDVRSRGSRSCSSPTSWRKPSGSVTGWRSSTRAASWPWTPPPGWPAGSSPGSGSSSGRPCRSTTACWPACPK